MSTPVSKESVMESQPEKHTGQDESRSLDKELVNGDIIEARLPYTAEEERAVRRKTDLVILPLLCMVFFLQYLDKQSLSYASVFGLLTDLNLTSNQYSWCSSIFYIGQLVSEYPFIYLMSRLPLARFVGVTIVIWGGVCMCLAAPKNYAGFAAVRFLLGFCEGAVSPAFVTMTSIWYRKDEHALRVGAWITMNGLAQIIGALLMYGIGKNSALALAPWRALFIICGALTFAGGIVFFFAMPSGPDKAWFLTEREREVATLRLAKDHDGGDKTNWSNKQLYEALTDVKSWLVFAFGVLVTMPSPVLTFASLVIKNIGYNKFQTMLYGAPSGAVQIFFIWVGVLGCFLWPNRRSLIVMILIIVPLVGNILLLKLSVSAGWGMIVASWLASVISDVFSITLSLSASNVKGNTKRSVVNTMYFIGYSAGCIGAPQLWKHSPRYISGVITDLVAWVLLLIVMAWYWYSCSSENKRRDQLMETEEVPVFEKGADVTDGEDLTFRYTC
ncbi:pantothenate transporter-2 [Coleophoma cylindrospora]|uniref:Pantothenate transporter-2 n=1 Tax=Coleophoma cylindrospora TaxID=1849047 RepID=A0A3D8QSW0_9HELO|nr:pantothenate transporter-2 [Coleophoma cylindrospora]